MEKRRVYQVAKEKKLSSDALISMLKSLGHEVKSHMSVVTPEMLDAIGKKIEEETKSSIEEVQRQKDKETKRKAEARPARPSGSGGGGGGASGGGSGPSGDSRSRAPRRPESGATPAPGATPSTPDDDASRRRGRRRGKVDEGMIAELRQTHSAEGRTPAASPTGGGGGKPASGGGRPPAAGKPPAATGGGDVSGRWRGGGRKKGRKQTGVDTQAVQDNVRKTLSQISEGRTRRKYSGRSGADDGGEEVTTEEAEVLHINEFATVSELAEAMHSRTAEVITTCLQLGVIVTINQRLDMDTMVTVADEFGFELRPLEQAEAGDTGFDDGIEEQENVGEPQPRPPVVTVMGHVDHGKTSLLDYLRKTDVVDGESGGITQHIGAYSVSLEGDRSITFLDTPGHAAFTAMRARGARVTDLVILIVAADDDVMPQTIEAINHAKAAQVPIVVAINKCDLPTADPEKIKRQLSEQDVLIEEWGGKVSCAEISATTGAGIDQLLELVMLEADVLELKAYPESRARGTIVEAQLDKGRGAVATVLVQEGTLRRADPFVTGMYGGRVRALMDENHKRIDAVGPGRPVQVLGLGGVPQAGDTLVVFATEREAKDIVQSRQQIKREQDARRRSVTLGDLQYQIQEGRIQELNVVVKGDVDGSVEAITQELGGITHDEVRIAVIHSSVGTVTESDILLASASRAVIIAFHVPIDPSARKIADDEGVEIREYSIIYEVIEELRAALSGLLTPTQEERVVGTLEVREVFSSSKSGSIAGCYVQGGNITRNHKVRLRRAEEVVWDGSISSLRRFKDDVREVSEGFECGVSLEGFNAIENGDLIEAIEIVETARSL
ncbi:MAG: translation initiation factor IF-2 [Gemmatimonadetes bacterium]|nr:translation initiation factor IF-2 [Gemmatimonadota bacterium]MBT5059943.1 translation initiation factor IF-2 [Gemmatimonadota bacterium]MBT5141954.1 translation initiation factor IF-2 [Gemmatimonadota bacterium]MBT5589756.1 translation initiation factor IF-2 [Gemmatimonadota bacterium]MBT5964067.1 translation initiation factor IF-2 [Gemmatimonadota bacterium]